jgi:hypothetical protein
MTLHRLSPSLLKLMPMIAFCLFAGFSQSVEAKVFRNSYVSFELPDKWDCALEQTEWVCKPVDPTMSQQAIVILTAKEVGPSDSRPSYEQHLKTARTIASRTGAPMQSNVLRVQQTSIANHIWVDGMHLSSEVPNYYTRYLATTKDRIAILVTFSAHVLHYTKYSPDFLRAIQSLRVIATKAMLSGNGAEGGGGLGSGTLGGPTGGIEFTDPDSLPEEGSGGGPSATVVESILGLAVILGAIGIYLLMKKGGKRR